jgi:hypothetical protein
VERVAADDWAGADAVGGLDIEEVLQAAAAAVPRFAVGAEEGIVLGTDETPSGALGFRADLRVVTEARSPRAARCCRL